MKTIFFDCKNGISGDMVLKALMDLSGQRDAIEEALKNEHLHTHDGHDHHGHSHDHHEHDHSHHHAHGRSWLKVRELIIHSSFSDEAKDTAISIYQNIAEAEASVHGETLETIHFHEVGRDEAIKNALGIGMALEAIKAGDQASDKGDSADLEIVTSPVYDGHGTVVCSHGEIPVPVPAVMALRTKCTYSFETADVNMEMVTPSGLASHMGIKAKPAVKTIEELLVEKDESGEPRVKLIAETEAKGSRDTGRDGLRVYLLDCREPVSGPTDRRNE